MTTVANGRLLRDPRTGTSFRFDAGAICLDFAHTGGEGPYAVFETLDSPDDLRRWVAEPPLLAEVTAAITRAGLRNAKRLRQAIWEAAQARAAGRALPLDAVAAINAFAAFPPLAPRISLDPADTGAALGPRSTWVPPVALTQVLSTLAREAIDLSTGPLAERLRTCASEDCALVFVDLSRPNTRRWCSMERCGNRHKVRALRDRQRNTSKAGR